MSSDDTFSMLATAASAPIATEMPCGHIFWGNPPDDCPVCAKIKAAREEEYRLWVETLRGNRDMHSDGRVSFCAGVIATAEDTRGEEVLELACDYMGNTTVGAVNLRQAFKERYEQG